MLGWSQRYLSEISGIAKATIADFETGSRRPHPRTLRDLREVLERAGVDFIDPAEGKGVGVRLRQP
jgi:transcriptional regulator with XRE-family HTH domain